MFFSFSDIQAPTDHGLAPFLFDGQIAYLVSRKYPLAPQTVGRIWKSIANALRTSTLPMIILCAMLSHEME
jgi:hypothetical protein